MCMSRSPCRSTVAEGRRMVEVAGETERVVQVGIHAALAEVPAGGGGVRALWRHRPRDRRARFHIQNEWPNGIGMWRDPKLPDERMWDEWLGPAPMVPYDRNRTFYNFRWFYDYSGGQLTNFGVHYMDMLRWCARQGIAACRWRRWAASSPASGTTGRFRTRSRCCGITATR